MCLRESMLAKIGKTLLCDKKRIVISSLFVKYLEHCLYGRKFLVKTPQLTSMADTKTQKDNLHARLTFCLYTSLRFNIELVVYLEMRCIE